MLSVQRINISLKKNKKKHSIQIFSSKKKKKNFFNLVSFEGFPQKQRL